METCSSCIALAKGGLTVAVLQPSEARASSRRKERLSQCPFESLHPKRWVQWAPLQENTFAVPQPSLDSSQHRPIQVYAAFKTGQTLNLLRSRTGKAITSLCSTIFVILFSER